MLRLALLLVLSSTLCLVTGGSSSAVAPQPADPPAKADPAKKDDPKGFGAGRTGAGKKRLLAEFGGSEASEEAVMLGLAWLTQMQKQDGSWVYEIGASGETAASTGMAMLAFLGAGQSHKTGRYRQTVQAGVDWLINNVSTDQNDAGRFKGASTMYGQGIATLALVEAYGLTQDKKIRPVAQAAIDYIQKAQGFNGSWGYQFGATGDTSIVGWQIQALHAASLIQDLKVDKKVIKKAVDFLNFVSTGQNKAVYGYTGPGINAAPASNLTAIGLLLRYYIDGWREKNAGFAEGVKGLMTKAPDGRTPPQFDMYYYYYATQVVRFYGGDLWKDWNDGPKDGEGKRKGGIPDWLISIQSRKAADRGSWNPDVGFFGGSCGRLGTTCMCLLTLEVYYRYTPENSNDQK